MSIKFAPEDAETEPIAAGQDVGRSLYSELLRSAPSEDYIRSWLYGFLSGFMEPLTRQAPVSATQCTVAAVVDPKQDVQACFTARVLEVQTFKLSDGTELRQIGLGVEGMDLQYRPGDELSLMPSNSPQAVRDVLRALRVSPQTLIHSGGRRAPAWQVLLELVQLDRVPHELFELMARHANTRDEVTTIDEMSASTDQYPRPLLAVLRRFPRIRPPADELVDVLYPLLPTVVPIASVCGANHRLEFLACCGTDSQYGTLGTSLLQRCRPSEWLTFSIRPGAATSSAFDPLVPVVFVCDGLGSAVVRTHLAKRALDSHRGRNWILGIDVWGTSGPFLDDAARWHASGLCRAVDSLPSDAALFERAFQVIEDSLWRWIVDNSVLYLALLDLERRKRFLSRLVRLLATRGHTDESNAKERLGHLEQAGRIIYWQPE